jgi:hypothetical protein
MEGEMLSRIAKLLLTSTAIAPVLFTYAYVACASGAEKQGILLFLLGVVLFVLCIFLLTYCSKHLEKVDFSMTTAEVADRENIGFLLLYLLPLFTSSFSALNWNIWIPAIVVFGAVVATGYSYHFNPLLGLLGWHFYKVGTAEGITYVLITKKQLRRATTNICVGQLTEYIVIDLEGE